MIRIAFTFVAVLALCASSNAAVRTFSATGFTDISVSDDTFELAAGALSDDNAFGAEILSTASINLASSQTTSTGSIPAGAYTLSRIDFGASTLYLSFSQGGYGVNDVVFYLSTPGDYPYVSGTDLVDDTATNPSVFFRNDLGGANEGYGGFVSGSSVTISTVPEPSAFAFGGLAVVVTGAGRWVRRRFFA